MRPNPRSAYLAATSLATAAVIHRPQVHVGVDEMNKFAVSDLVNYLIAIGAGTSVFAAPHKLHFVAEFTNHVEAVVGRGVVEYKDGIVMLRQHLW
jgi:hypothetical protein